MFLYNHVVIYKRASAQLLVVLKVVVQALTNQILRIYQPHEIENMTPHQTSNV